MVILLTNQTKRMHMYLDSGVCALEELPVVCGPAEVEEELPALARRLDVVQEQREATLAVLQCGWHSVWIIWDRLIGIITTFLDICLNVPPCCSLVKQRILSLAILQCLYAKFSTLNMVHSGRAN